ncbi:protein phosphatase 2C [Bacillus toyonensis]|uniref:protein phosphatase 2C n=1 Tax=Bacillus toyonensis TaxID=155322 RepID=UPI0026F7C9B5|nr:protein phosphatase 2C [Bacillus toyonensis]MDO8159843.1 protein phosphatase 2C [Bacillus toyonensis]
MLKKIKKFMVVVAAAVMLSAGFATVAPKEASAHWADSKMNWAMRKGIITAYMPDNLATRQDMWLMILRYRHGGSGDYNYNDAQSFVIQMDISDGSRGTNWITRSEAAAMILQMQYRNMWSPIDGFAYSDYKAKQFGIFDGTRGSEFATRAEVVTMLYNTPF